MQLNVIENDAPQGSGISPFLFSIINDIYDQVGLDTGKLLFANDGAPEKRKEYQVHFLLSHFIKQKMFQQLNFYLPAYPSLCHPSYKT